MQECQNEPVISQSLQSILIEFGMLLRLFSVMNIILNLASRPVNNQGRESYLDGVVKKRSKKGQMLACVYAFTDQFLSDLIW